MRHQLVLDASSAAVRQRTDEAGSGIWSPILETHGSDAPPVKKIVCMHRDIPIKGGEKVSRLLLLRQLTLGSTRETIPFTIEACRASVSSLLAAKSAPVHFPTPEAWGVP